MPAHGGGENELLESIRKSLGTSRGSRLTYTAARRAGEKGVSTSASRDNDMDKQILRWDGYSLRKKVT